MPAAGNAVTLLQFQYPQAFVAFRTKRGSKGTASRCFQRHDASRFYDGV